jgi:hypothetical protein
LLSFRGFDTPSLPAQGEQRRSTYFNIGRDIPWPAPRPYPLVLGRDVWGQNWRLPIAESPRLTLS